MATSTHARHSRPKSRKATREPVGVIGLGIMPHLRPIFAEHEDICWPKALPAAERAKPGAQSAAAKAQAERKVGAAA